MASRVRESSPQPEHVSQKPEPKRRRFILIRGLRRIFRIKSQSPESEENKPSCNETTSSLDTGLDASKSRSIDGLDGNSLPLIRNNLPTPILSVSLDSVFNPAEQHPSLPEFKSAASLLQDELLQTIRKRTDDAGHPQSLSIHSPNIATGNDLLSSKELTNKSSHSTCSDGSFLSVESSEMDEDSFGAHNSRYSSKISLHDKRTSQTHLDSSDCDSSASITLSHEAAKHRIAIRPPRNHPRSKKPLTLTNALPAMPEVNEENSGRSTSPAETKAQIANATDGTTTSTSTSTTDAAACTTVDDAPVGGSCDLDTSVDEISVANVPRRGEGFFHRLLSRRSTKKKAAGTTTGGKCGASAEDADVDRFLFDEATGARPRQREEPPRANRMQLSYPPDLPHDDDHVTDSRSRAVAVAARGGPFESDTFAPIKQSFSIGQQQRSDEAVSSRSATTVDDDVISSNSGTSSVLQKSLSSDSVSSTALDESTAAAAAGGVTAERCRSYSSSDSSAEHHHHHQSSGGVNNGLVVANQQQHAPLFSLPVPAPRLSKLYTGGGGGGAGGGGTAEVVMRKKKRDDHQQQQQQQPELLKVFARRSLKLGKDGEPELLLLAGGDDDGSTTATAAKDEEENIVCTEEVVAEVGDEVYVVVVDKKQQHHDDGGGGGGGPEVDVNENQTTAVDDRVVPQFKGIKQRKQEWEKRLLRQQQ